MNRPSKITRYYRGFSTPYSARQSYVNRARTEAGMYDGEIHGGFAPAHLLVAVAVQAAAVLPSLPI
jgi:hypothetical protein